MRWDAVKETYRLCTRELEVLQLLYDGLLNKQIAHQLGIKRSTVATHIRRIYAKVGPHRRDDDSSPLQEKTALLQDAYDVCKVAFIMSFSSRMCRIRGIVVS